MATGAQSYLKALAALILVMSVTITANAQDKGREIADWRHIKRICTTMKDVETIMCVAFTSGFIESMEFHEHMYGLEPTCLGLINRHELGNRVIKRIRADTSLDSWTGLHLTAIVGEESGCRYTRMKNPSMFPKE